MIFINPGMYAGIENINKEGGKYIPQTWTQFYCKMWGEA